MPVDVVPAVVLASPTGGHSGTSWERFGDGLRRPLAGETSWRRGPR
ncbi:hypothetical protein [Actinomadura terrae]|nr:hypothetical protein [Actinomadura terrae]